MRPWRDSLSRQTGLSTAVRSFRAGHGRRMARESGNQPTASGNQPVVEMARPEMKKRGN